MCADDKMFTKRLRSNPCSHKQLEKCSQLPQQIMDPRRRKLRWLKYKIIIFFVCMIWYAYCKVPQHKINCTAKTAGYFTKGEGQLLLPLLPL